MPPLLLKVPRSSTTVVRSYPSPCKVDSSVFIPMACFSCSGVRLLTNFSRGTVFSSEARTEATTNTGLALTDPSVLSREVRADKRA